MPSNVIRSDSRDSPRLTLKMFSLINAYHGPDSLTIFQCPIREVLDLYRQGFEKDPTRYRITDVIERNTQHGKRYEFNAYYLTDS